MWLTNMNRKGTYMNPRLLHRLPAPADGKKTDSSFYSKYKLLKRLEGVIFKAAGAYALFCDKHASSCLLYPAFSAHGKELGESWAGSVMLSLSFIWGKQSRNSCSDLGVELLSFISQPPNTLTASN